MSLMFYKIVNIVDKLSLILLSKLFIFHSILYNFPISNIFNGELLTRSLMLNIFAYQSTNEWTIEHVLCSL